MILLPPSPPLFPYTTLFRSMSLSTPTTVNPLPANCRAASAPIKPAEPVITATLILRLTLTAKGWVRASCVHRLASARHPREARSEEHTSELQSHVNLVCRLL